VVKVSTYYYFVLIFCSSLSRPFLYRFFTLNYSLFLLCYTFWTLSKQHKKLLVSFGVDVVIVFAAVVCVLWYIKVGKMANFNAILCKYIDTCMPLHGT